ncbi:MAG: zinc ribbon domain-containing protein [Coriobacteriales bacterium]|nr:zinc ribbon domain-containing protein [Coriobacteriales bacterium]
MSEINKKANTRNTYQNRFCPNCGSKIEGSEKFCLNCGQNLDSLSRLDSNNNNINQSEIPPTNDTLKTNAYTADISANATHINDNPANATHINDNPANATPKHNAAINDTSSNDISTNNPPISTESSNQKASATSAITSKKKSKTPLIIGLSLAALAVVAILIVVFAVKPGSNSDSPSVSNSSPKEESITVLTKCIDDAGLNKTWQFDDLGNLSSSTLSGAIIGDTNSEVKFENYKECGLASSFTIHASNAYMPESNYELSDYDLDDKDRPKNVEYKLTNPKPDTSDSLSIIFEYYDSGRFKKIVNKSVSTQNPGTSRAFSWEVYNEYYFDENSFITSQSFYRKSNGTIASDSYDVNYTYEGDEKYPEKCKRVQIDSHDRVVDTQTATLTRNSSDKSQIENQQISDSNSNPSLTYEKITPKNDFAKALLYIQQNTLVECGLGGIDVFFQ